MSMTREQVIAEAMQLSSEEREAIAEELWQSIDEPITNEQIAELDRRLDEIERGDAKFSSVEDVMMRLRGRKRK